MWFSFAWVGSLTPFHYNRFFVHVLYKHISRLQDTTTNRIYLYPLVYYKLKTRLLLEITPIRSVASSTLCHSSTSKGVMRKSRPGSKTKYYAVVEGKNGFTGVVQSWEECKKLTNHVRNVRHKSFATNSQAEQFISEVLENPSKRQKKNFPVAEKKSTKPRREKPNSAKGEGPKGDKVLNVYTDGACVDNGGNNAKAGYGVYFGKEDERNISASLPGDVQTNNRAELTAVITALESIQNEPLLQDPEAEIHVHTDSRYVRDMLKKGWIKQWKANNWRRSGGELKNTDLVQRLDDLWSAIRNQGKAKIFIEWVRGHDGNEGNEEADKLANEGVYKTARYPKNN